LTVIGLFDTYLVEPNGAHGRPVSPEVTMAGELIAFASKQEMLAKSKQFCNPDKIQFWIDSGVPLVIDRWQAEITIVLCALAGREQ
jgi:hypothetical protein